jgi:hypothetical protein
MAGICVDITHRKRTEQDLRFVARVIAEPGCLLDRQQTLDKITRLSVPAFADWCAVDLVDDQGGLKRVAVARVDPATLVRCYTELGIEGRGLAQSGTAPAKNTKASGLK